jgi:multidrug resistance efflux pump
VKRFASIALTLVLIAGIIYGVCIVWDRYSYTPWTRDGRVRAQVIHLAPDVSGWVDSLHAENAAQVKAGDTLFTVDRARYKVALDLAEAQQDSAKVAWERSASIYKRRSAILDGGVSREETDLARLDVAEKFAAYKQAMAGTASAKIDLARTVYKAPVDGKIINLTLEKGDYVNKGVDRLALVSSSSYYVTGYFEETKIPSIRIGDPVEIWMMAGTIKLLGHVSSVDAGISNKNLTPDNELLPDVEPNFTWIRLAQRIPVNVKIDHIPDHVVLSSGMSATLKVLVPGDRKKDERSVWHAVSTDAKAIGQ